jgi:hypothetical protein
MRSVTVLASAPATNEAEFRALSADLRARTDLGYDEEGRSRGPEVSAPAATPSGPPLGARDPGPSAPGADHYLRTHAIAALTGVPVEPGWWDRA